MLFRFIRPLDFSTDLMNPGNALCKAFPLGETSVPRSLPDNPGRLSRPGALPGLLFRSLPDGLFLGCTQEGNATLQDNEPAAMGGGQLPILRALHALAQSGESPQRTLPH